MPNTLVGTFVDGEITPSIVRKIVECFEIDRLFVFQFGPENHLITFNTIIPEELREFKREFRDTIELHRSKANNTLFTINGLNAMIRHQGKKRVDWTEHKNSCVLTNPDGSIRVLRTRLKEVIEL